MSCARLGLTGGPKKKEEKPQPFGPTGIPPELRAKGGGSPVTPGGNVAPAPLNFTPESDIAWTDPDHPEAGIPELNTLLEGPKRGPWEENDKEAFRRASREGKPVLIWFTDSKNSPGCKALSAELFSKGEFESWAKERFVRLRVDSQIRQRDPNLSLDEAATKEATLREYTATLKKRYKVLGHPTVLVLSPDGEVIGRYKGYKSGDADYFWGLLKQGDTVAQKRYGEWRAGMEKKGYREWQDRSGRKVFAKLLAYSEGKLLLVEPDGARSKTTEARLSDADREWIRQQKAMRGL
ncbi:MAG TPA: thioredoxin family protein [Luteolibacter sp.]